MMRAAFWRVFVSAFLAAGLFLLAPNFAEARRVEAHQPMTEEASTPSALKPLALEKVFAQAVQQEALSILPRPLPPDRRMILESYLSDGADHFVYGYEELSEQSGVAGLSLTADVMVNRQALRDCLEQLGLLSFRTKPAPVRLELVSVPPEDSEFIQSLLRLCNMEQSDAEGPLLRLEFVPTGTRIQGSGDRAQSVKDPFWKGSLMTPNALWSATSPDLPTLWAKMAGKFMSTLGDVAGALSEKQLVVQGWYASDGVQEFDRLLDDWLSLVQESQLQSLSMQPEGIEAVWSIKILNPVGLYAKLDSYVASRSLSYKIVEPQAPEEPDGAPGAADATPHLDANSDATEGGLQ